MRRGGNAKKVIENAAYIAAVVLLVWIFWAIAAKKADSEFIVPTPGSAIKTLWRVLGEAEVYRVLWRTLCRTLLAYAVSLVVALVAALLGTRFSPIAKLLSPLVSVLRTLPTMAVVLLLVIWTSRRAAVVIIALLVIMPTLYSAILSALSGVDRDILDMARVDGAKGRVLILRFYLPLALPACVLPVSTSASLTLKLIVAAEVLAGTYGSAMGLGSAMQMASVYYETARLMALTVLTVVVGLALEKLLYALFSLLSRRVT